MANQNGRNVALPDENRPSWRPQDDEARRHQRGAQHFAADDGLGQSGYGAGRQSDDRSLDFQTHHQSYGGAYYEDRSRGDDDRFTSRGGPMQGQGGNNWNDVNRGPGTYGVYPGERGGYDQGNRGGNYGPRDQGGRATVAGPQAAQGNREWNQYGAEPRVSHRGKGPANYQRTDERIHEAVADALTEHDEIDATHIEVTVTSGVVSLSGMVDDRNAKRLAEDIAAAVSGVQDVENRIRVARTNPAVHGTSTSATDGGQSRSAHGEHDAAAKKRS